jgi:hypothetical protein
MRFDSVHNNYESAFDVHVHRCVLRKGIPFLLYMTSKKDQLRHKKYNCTRVLTCANQCVADELVRLLNCEAVVGTKVLADALKELLK